ncbi:MAG TPA: hypothetical protein VG095_07070 [Chthoniobacterales bacterium]|nr:hypothetical protein [Chthoniobacterales bacterium]
MRLNRRLLIAALVAFGAVVPLTQSDAQHISISIRDRPYYTHGPYYWHNDVRYVWVPGHWSSRGLWVRGHYVARERRTPLQRLKARHRAHRRALFGR